MPHPTSLVFLLLLLIVHTAGLADCNCRAVKQMCLQPPPMIVDAFERIYFETSRGLYGEDTSGVFPCVFEMLEGDCHIESALEVHEQHAVPASQGWSICLNCILDPRSKEVTIYRRAASTKIPTAEDGQLIDLSWSLWGEFFPLQNDRYHGRIEHFAADQTGALVIGNNVLFVSRPVFILPMITVHVGHVLVDLLEQVYFAMQRSYGRIRKDALIVIDVSNKDERRVLLEKLMQQVHGEVDSVCRLLRLFTDLPVISVEALFSVNKPILFSDLHIGLDMRDAHFHHGFDLHPCILYPSINGINLSLYERHSLKYLQFKDFLWANMRLSRTRRDMRNNPNSLHVTFVQRNDIAGRGRTIVNIEEVYSTVEKINPNATIHITDLSEVSFSVQLDLFAKTDVLVAVGGTALHNSIFMHPGTSILAIMPTAWCHWAWMYLNQASLQNIHFEVYCNDEGDLKDYIGRSFHWTKNFWLQGPRLTKTENIHINIDRFLPLLNSSMKVAAKSFKDKAKASLSQSLLLFNSLLPRCGSSQSAHIGGSNLNKHRPLWVENDPGLRVFVTSITHKGRTADGYWDLSIMGQIVAESSEVQSLFESFPYLSVCMVVLDLDMEKPWCHPVETYNYYSNLLVALPNPTCVFLFWLQVSSYGGKIAGSEVYVAMDARLPGDESGMSIHRVNVQNFSVDISMQGSDSSSSFTYTYLGPHSLQFAIADFCKLHRFSIIGCSFLTRVISQRVYRLSLLTTHGLPVMQRMPSPIRPFVFLHIEKTAGTSLREHLYDAAVANGIVPLIPCHGGIHCVAVDVKDINTTNVDLENASVIAGHFSWGVWNQLPSYRPTNPDSPPPCLVMGRHPVDRAISYYYQRCYGSSSCIGYNRRINDITPEELRTIALLEREGKLKEDNSTLIILDEGMSDAACRALLNQKATTGLIIGQDRIVVPSMLPVDAAEAAKARLRKCVVGIVERMDETKRVIAEWFPWVKNIEREKKKLMQIYSNKETSSDLRDDLRAVLLEVNICDVQLYEEMLRLFHLQLEVSMAKSFEE